jgi:hypothetical protein
MYTSREMKKFGYKDVYKYIFIKNLKLGGKHGRILF